MQILFSCNWYKTSQTAEPFVTLPVYNSFYYQILFYFVGIGSNEASSDNFAQQAE